MKKLSLLRLQVVQRSAFRPPGKSIRFLLSKGQWRVRNPDDVLAEGVDGLGVDVMDPLVGRLPDDDPDPESQVGGHQVNEPKSGEQSKSLHDDGGVDEQKVHLEEGEEGLKEK